MEQERSRVGALSTAPASCLGRCGGLEYEVVLADANVLP